MLGEVLDLLILHRVEEEVEHDHLVVLAGVGDAVEEVQPLAVGQLGVRGGDGVAVLTMQR